MATVRPDFINVDLSVAGRANLEPLVAALSRRTLLLASYRVRGRHHVRFELKRQPSNAQQGIRAFAQLVRTLPQTARRLWNSARSRDFDIGIEVPRCQYQSRDCVRCSIASVLSEARYEPVARRRGFPAARCSVDA